MKMKKVIGYILLNVALVSVAIGQRDIREQVYIHLNSQTLVSGEMLYLSAYCNSQLTGESSDLSKILYLEIVGENGSIHQQKIALEKGRGQAEFFISSMIPSGQYYVIAYTRWMKNFDNYFQSPIVIINPFETYKNDKETYDKEFSLFPMTDPLVADLENTFAFQINSADPLKYKGKLVNGSGAVVRQLSVDEFGLGKCSFIPKKDQSYKVILEDGVGNLSFYELPSVKEEGNIVTYTENDKYLKIKWLSSSGNKSQEAKIVVLSNGEPVYQSKILSNQNLEIEKSQLPNGLIMVQVISSNGDLYTERLIMPKLPQLQEFSAKANYQTRQEVKLDFEIPEGEYSLSVRKILGASIEQHDHSIYNAMKTGLLKSSVEPADYLPHASADPEIFVLTSLCRKFSKIPDSVNWLPEVREEIMTGVILDSLGKPMADEPVALSFPGEPFQLRIGESNANGQWQIPFQSSLFDYDAYVTSLNFDTNSSIQSDDPFLSNYLDLDFSPLFLDSVFVKKVIERAVRIQIENVYQDLTPSKMITNPWAMVFPVKKEYQLDDYTRFSTLKETFTEFVMEANVREWRKPAIKTTYFGGIVMPEYPPLILLDGLPIQGGEILSYDAYQVESIKVIPNQYVLGSTIIDGIVDIGTKGHKLDGYRLSSNYQKVSVIGVDQHANYVFENPTVSNHEQLPDQREQLFWNPKYNPSVDGNSVVIYTSDVKGEFEVVLEGFSESGVPISQITRFFVN
jgi:hypothetical protein